MTATTKTVHSNLRNKLLSAKDKDGFKEILHYFIHSELDGEIIKIDEIFKRDQPKYRALFIDTVKELINENYPVEFSSDYTRIRKTI